MGIYAAPADFVDDEAGEELSPRLTAAVDQARKLVRGLGPRDPEP